jgi:hypothetical protein
MTYGWRPFSVVSQPARIAMNPSGHAQPAARRYQRDANIDSAPPQHRPGQSESNQEEADADHDAERKEDDRDPRLGIRGKVRERRHTAIPIMRDDEAAQVRDGDRRAIHPGMLIGQRKEHEIHGAGVAPVRFDGGNLCRLILQACSGRADRRAGAARAQARRACRRPCASWCAPPP